MISAQSELVSHLEDAARALCRAFNSEGLELLDGLEVEDRKMVIGISEAVSVALTLTRDVCDAAINARPEL